LLKGDVLFEGIFNSLSHSISNFGIVDVLDILVVVVLIYFLLKLTSKTRAIQVLKGFGIIIILAQFTQFLGMSTISWLLNYIINAGALVLIVLFQPELRRALERIGTGRILDRNFSENNAISNRIDKIIASCLYFAKTRTGSLIVVENKTGLNDIIETGTIINSDISSELLENLFFMNAPLHDGAVVLRDDKILAAGCFLPLSDNRLISQDLGTRHRAGLGISEISDSITIIISEETGVISIAKHGKLIRYIDKKALRDNLEIVFNYNNMNDSKISKILKRKAKK
jgi:diadenylate cyclase